MSIVNYPLQALPFQTYTTLPDEHDTWLVEGLVPTGGFVNLYGPPKSMKSFLAIQLALALTTKTPTWLGHEVKRHGPVYYLQLDTPRSLWKKRFIRLMEKGLPLMESVEGLFLADRKCAPFPFNILDPNHAIWLRDEVNRTGAIMVIMDTYRKLFRGSENDSDISDMVLTSVAKACGDAAVMVISHSKKSPSDPSSEHSVSEGNRGSNAVAGGADTIMQLRRKGGGGRIRYEGRDTEDGVINLRQDKETVLWQLTPEDEIRYALPRIMKDPTLTTDMARAKALAAITGQALEAARTSVRRWSPTL